MRAVQRTFKARVKSENTSSLFNLLSKMNTSDSIGGKVSQRTTKMRVRSDGKSKGTAIRKKNV